MTVASLLGVKVHLWRQCPDLSAEATSAKQFREAIARGMEVFGIFCPEAFFQVQSYNGGGRISGLVKQDVGIVHKKAERI